MNVWFHRLTGVHMWVYTVTDRLGLVPIGICLVFGVPGAVQLFKRKSLFKVDPEHSRSARQRKTLPAVKDGAANRNITICNSA